MRMVEQFEAPNKEEYNGRFHESRQIVKDGDEGKIVRLHADFLFEVHDILASISSGEIGLGNRFRHDPFSNH